MHLNGIPVVVDDRLTVSYAVVKRWKRRGRPMAPDKVRTRAVVKPDPHVYRLNTDAFGGPEGPRVLRSPGVSLIGHPVIIKALMEHCG